MRPAAEVLESAVLDRWAVIGRTKLYIQELAEPLANQLRRGHPESFPRVPGDLSDAQVRPGLIDATMGGLQSPGQIVLEAGELLLGRRQLRFEFTHTPVEIGAHQAGPREKF